MARKRILVVDDEMDMRIYIGAVLKSGGFEPIFTKEGSQGLALAEKEPPDLIILDVMMPGEGGVETFRKLRQESTLKDVPVMMLSAVKKESFFHFLKMLNARSPLPVTYPSVYVEKPFEPEELLAAVKKALA